MREHHDSDLVRSLEGLISSSNECSTICVDDRFVNSRLVCKAIDGTEVSVICVLDILHHLRSQKILSDTEFWNKKHKLRQQGFISHLLWMQMNSYTGLKRQRSPTEISWRVLSYERFVRQ